MKKKIFSIFVLSFLFLLSTVFPAQAEIKEKGSQQMSPTLEKVMTRGGGEGGFEQGTFTLEVKDNLINLQAEQASFKEILNDLEKKTGIKVNIFDGVEDKKVIPSIKTTLSMRFIRYMKNRS